MHVYAMRIKKRRARAGSYLNRGRKGGFVWWRARRAKVGRGAESEQFCYVCVWSFSSG